MRRYEREADNIAVELTGSAKPMINALKRLAKDNLANLHPHPLYVWFYYSHPPLLERIKNLQAMEVQKEQT
jgi:STE24 endopeptidase